jgi:hypothetical protein
VVRGPVPSKKVVFDVIYEGDLFGVSKITEHYVLSTGRVELTTELAGYKGALRYVWPILADDGRTKSNIAVKDGVVFVSQPGASTAQTFEPRRASNIHVETELYPNHNGWAQLGVGEFPRGGKIALVIRPKVLR